MSTSARVHRVLILIELSVGSGDPRVLGVDLALTLGGRLGAGGFVRLASVLVLSHPRLELLSTIGRRPILDQIDRPAFLAAALRSKAIALGYRIFFEQYPTMHSSA